MAETPARRPQRRLAPCPARCRYAMAGRRPGPRALSGPRGHRAAGGWGRPRRTPCRVRCVAPGPRNARPRRGDRLACGGLSLPRPCRCSAGEWHEQGQMAGPRPCGRARSWRDEAMAANHAARADRRVARAQLALARERPEDSDLRAPFAGTIRRRIVEPGAVVAATRPIYLLARTEPLWVSAYVAEPDLGRLAPGMRVEVVSGSRPERPYRGQVGVISPTAECTPETVYNPTCARARSIACASSSRARPRNCARECRSPSTCLTPGRTGNDRAARRDRGGRETLPRRGRGHHRPGLGLGRGRRGHAHGSEIGPDGGGQDHAAQARRRAHGARCGLGQRVRPACRCARGRGAGRARLSAAPSSRGSGSTRRCAARAFSSPACSR